MAHRRALSGLGVLAAAALTLSACGADASDNAITVGFPGSLGPGDVPFVTALDTLEADGWDVEYVEFDSPDVQTQALLSNDIQVAAMGPATVMAANENGANLRIVGDNMRLDYFIVGAGDVAECADFDGRTLAYHSEGSTSTAHLRRYLADVCPEAEPEFIVISGSANRITALEEGQIDGTIVRVEDWLSADNEASGVHVVDNLSETQTEFLAHSIVIDGDRAEEVGPGVQALMEAFDAELASLNEDPAAFAEQAAEILGSTTEELVPVYEGLVELGLFPETHDLDPAHLDATLGFYVESGTISEGLTVEDIADLEITSGGGQ